MRRRPYAGQDELDRYKDFVYRRRHGLGDLEQLAKCVKHAIEVPYPNPEKGHVPMATAWIDPRTLERKITVYLSPQPAYRMGRGALVTMTPEGGAIVDAEAGTYANYPDLPNTLKHEGMLRKMQLRLPSFPSCKLGEDLSVRGLLSIHCRHTVVATSQDCKTIANAVEKAATFATDVFYDLAGGSYWEQEKEKRKSAPS